MWTEMGLEELVFKYDLALVLDLVFAHMKHGNHLFVSFMYFGIFLLGWVGKWIAMERVAIDFFAPSNCSALSNLIMQSRQTG